MQIIGIAGKAGHGKTTLAEMLKVEFEKKNMRVVFINYADILKFMCKTYYGWNGEKDEYGRTLLQKVGTDIGRKQVDEDIWVQLLDKVLSVMKFDFDVAIIGDCRFPNEISYWEAKELDDKDLHFYSIQITRPDFESPLTEEQQQHPSETALDNYLGFTYEVLNKDLEQLQESAAALVYDMLNE